MDMLWQKSKSLFLPRSKSLFITEMNCSHTKVDEHFSSCVVSNCE